jgi:hypothetical protein
MNFVFEGYSKNERRVMMNWRVYFKPSEPWRVCHYAWYRLHGKKRTFYEALK